MKRILFVFFTICTSVLFASCDDKDDNSGDFLRGTSANFITDYVLPQRVEVSTLGYGENNEVLSLLEFGGDTLRNISKAPDYLNLARQYGDTAYNDNVAMNGNYALSQRIDSVRIVSDVDYDASHKSGVDLSGVCSIKFESYGNFVLSKYNDGNYSGYLHEENVHEKINNLTDWQRSLVRPYFIRIIYDSLPTLSQVHNMTFTFYFEGGTVLSATQQMDFGKVK